MFFGNWITGSEETRVRLDARDTDDGVVTDEASRHSPRRRRRRSGSP